MVPVQEDQSNCYCYVYVYAAVISQKKWYYPSIYVSNSLSLLSIDAIHLLER